ncbi:MAG TPA: exosortase E/protease, VPEID-CTERM system [Steroidobacteraceae bacterium]|nr:exosortase E/protease, VPEID-CTERM system [Steroidobacteraceae bacterium]
MSNTQPGNPSPPLARENGAHMGLGARVALLVLVLFGEKFTLNFFVDTASADTARGAGAAVRLLQHFGFRFAVPFILALALFIAVGRGGTLERINLEARGARIRSRWLMLHAALIAALAVSLTFWYRAHGLQLPMVGVSLVLAAAAGIALLAGLAPLALWRGGAAALGIRWLYAAAAAALACAMFSWSQQLWGSTAQMTFQLVKLLLEPFLPSLHADAATRTLATTRFAIYVAPECSGLEGVALMVVFSSGWLLYFRREYLFPRALVLVPAGVLLIFGLNVVRIAVLMLIGDAGLAAMALYGFHSQAGWIAFNCAACGLAVASRHSAWLSPRAARDHAATAADANPTAAYLLPLLAILAAGMVSRAVSSGFETWYALRLVAAAAVLAIWWRPLAKLDWRFGWRAVGVGAAIFALWLAAAHFLLAARPIPAQLAAMPAGARALWLAARVLTGVVLVPIAQELAYRGYLMRRLLAEDFTAVPFAAVGWVPLLVAAAAYCLLQGALWLPAIGGGIAYGLVLIRSGRMGEAVAAHAITNLLLAAAVLAAGQWQLWR